MSHYSISDSPSVRNHLPVVSNLTRSRSAPKRLANLRHREVRSSPVCTAEDKTNKEDEDGRVLSKSLPNGDLLGKTNNNGKAICISEMRSLIHNTKLMNNAVNSDEPEQNYMKMTPRNVDTTINLSAKDPVSGSSKVLRKDMSFKGSIDGHQTAQKSDVPQIKIDNFESGSGPLTGKQLPGSASTDTSDNTTTEYTDRPFRQRSLTMDHRDLSNRPNRPKIQRKRSASTPDARYPGILKNTLNTTGPSTPTKERTVNFALDNEKKSSAQESTCKLPMTITTPKHDTMSTSLPSIKSSLEPAISERALHQRRHSFAVSVDSNQSEPGSPRARTPRDSVSSLREQQGRDNEDLHKRVLEYLDKADTVKRNELIAKWKKKLAEAEAKKKTKSPDPKVKEKFELNSTRMLRLIVKCTMNMSRWALEARLAEEAAGYLSSDSDWLNN